MGISNISYSIISILIFINLHTQSYAAKRSYIVYMREQHSIPGLKEFYKAATDTHVKLLESVFPQVADVKDQIIYSYQRIFNGFAISLDEEQAALLAKHPSVISVERNMGRKMTTTYSWDFLGLNNASIPKSLGLWGNKFGQDSGKQNLESLWQKANYGESMIIGNLDSGVWPESPSFNDDGMGFIPAKWRGICQQDGNVTCNRKLIGARYFHKGYEAEVGKIDPSMLNARDNDGHGTHTLSTAGGTSIPNVTIFKNVHGTIGGGAPRARVAAYKVCWPSNKDDEGGCFDADILAAFDAAISDGVDVISMSLGGSGVEMYVDATAKGSFHAIEAGVVVVTSAGNEGPLPGTVKNVAPWILTVAASSTDRNFASYVSLSNNLTIMGASLSETTLPVDKFYPLIRGKDAGLAEASLSDSELCMPGSLDSKKVANKILVCLRGKVERAEKGHQALLAGAVGMILVNDEESGNQTLAEPHILPVSHISFADGQLLYRYINSTRNPTAFINPVKTEFRREATPVIASFTSRGPNPFEESILKPDITAPGINIIAGYPASMSPSGLDSDKRRVPFNIMSGTSMSCPHIAAVVALLKAIHPFWTPAAIKSAIMTTATTEANNKMPIMDSNGEVATPFEYGSGHVRAELAVDPGLVYDLNVNDYWDFLCTRTTYPYRVKASSKIPISPCSTTFSLVNFNYPSITVPNINGLTTITRKLKNVGTPGSYRVTIQAPPEIMVKVAPTTLVFSMYGQEHMYSVSFLPQIPGLPQDYVFGRIIWSDGIHNVSSPLVLKHAMLD